MPISGDTLYSFRWYFRPETPAWAVPIVVLRGDEEEVPHEAIPAILSEIDNRHWGVIRQLLIEAKTNIEGALRDERTIMSPQITSFYFGQLAAIDYVLANFEGLRSGQLGPDKPEEMLR